MQYSQEHLKTMVYAKFGGQTGCIMGNWKIENERIIKGRKDWWKGGTRKERNQKRTEQKEKKKERKKKMAERQKKKGRK